MNICRFEDKSGAIRVGAVTDGSAIADLTPAGISAMVSLLESRDPAGELNRLLSPNLPRLSLSDVRLRASVERQEV